MKNLRKILRKILLASILVGIIFATIFYFLVRQYGKPIVEQELSRIFQQPVAIQSVKVIPPAKIVFDEFHVPGMFEAESVSLRLGLPNIFTREWTVARVRLKNPVIYLTRKSSGEVVLGGLVANASSTTSEVPGVAASQAGKAESATKDWGVLVERLNVRGGKIYFQDNAASPNSTSRIEKFDLSASRLAYPLRPLRTKFHFSAQVISDQIPFTGGLVEGQGWVNWSKRDTQTQISLRDAQGNTVFSANAQAVNNDMTVRGTTKINSLDFILPKKQKEGKFSVGQFFLGAAKTAGVEVDMEYSFKTKMDHFEVGSVSLSGNIGYAPGGKIGKFATKDEAVPATKP